MSTLLYNPDRKSKDQLISEFVVRTQVFNEIMHDLETSKMDYPEQHYLLVGQRGTGKTTLLNRLKYGIQDSQNLQNTLIPVIFNEEQYNISELANLWESVAQFLEDYPGFNGIYNEIEKHIEKKNFEELSYDILEKYLCKYNKRLVLLIDNVGDLLKKLDKTEVHRLREILQTKKEIRLIAGSSFYLETILDYHQPFFEFFKVIRLDGLDEHETQNLLLKLGELNNENEKIEKIVNETPERIETLRTLTGGVPRTIALMYRIFTDYNDESIVKDLERILDAVTPLYKHRMDDLPIQQQKIVDSVAKNWDAISVKDLKDKVRIDSKNISAQLRQLEKNQIIEKRETGTKNHLYLLKERFFNIWYLMRYGRKDDKQKVIWLVRFLESWCSSKDLRVRVLDYVEKINSGQLTSSAVEFYASVYSAFKNIDPEIKILLKKTVPIHISNNINISKKEIDSAIAKYTKEENWTKVLEVAQHLNEFNLETRQSILIAVLFLFMQRQKHEVFESILKKSSELTNNNSADISFTNFEIEVLDAIIFSMLQEKISKREFEDVFSMIKAYILSPNKEEPNENSFKYSLLTQTLAILMALNQLNLVSKIFNEIKELNLSELLKPVYFSLVYLKDGKDSLEYLKAGPEIQETIGQILESVEMHREKIKRSELFLKL